MRLQKYLFSVIFFFSLCFNFYAQENYTLQKALQTAKANNSVLKTEQHNIDIAEAEIITAKLRPNPILNIKKSRFLKDQAE